MHNAICPVHGLSSAVVCCDVLCWLWLCAAAQGNIRESVEEVDEATKAKMAQFVNKTIMMEEVRIRGLLVHSSDFETTLKYFGMSGQ
jgi:hypothetical protein